jgi:hypothetical protein
MPENLLNILADGRLFHSWDDMYSYLSIRGLKVVSINNIEDNNYEVTITFK